jgi:glycosyltransferase involved in cell wall biosynthesis
MDNPLVSVIVPTKNSAATLERCLVSVRRQTYQPIELIIVDNYSSDETQNISERYADKFLLHGPERSAQRNLGVGQCRGEFVVMIDSDMELQDNVIASCVNKITSTDNLVGITIPEESFGQGFWANCKRLERSFYQGVDWMEAARFFKTSSFLLVGGYAEEMVSGEDWDLSQRIEKEGEISHINDFIFHNEGKMSLWQTIKKKFYYAVKFCVYADRNKSVERFKNQTGMLCRYRLLFSRPDKLLRDPVLAAGMIFMKTCEFFFGGLGFITGKFIKIYKK